MYVGGGRLLIAQRMVRDALCYWYTLWGGMDEWFAFVIAEFLLCEREKGISNMYGRKNKSYDSLLTSRPC